MFTLSHKEITEQQNQRLINHSIPTNAQETEINCSRNPDHNHRIQWTVSSWKYLTRAYLNDETKANMCLYIFGTQTKLAKRNIKINTLPVSTQASLGRYLLHKCKGLFTCVATLISHPSCVHNYVIIWSWSRWFSRHIVFKPIIF